MRRWSIVAGFVIAVGVVAVIAFPAIRPSAVFVPKAVTPASSCQIQAVVGDNASCEIVVRNGGWRTLTLGKAKTPPGLTIEGAGSSVGPRGTTTIRAVVDTNVVVGKGSIPVAIRSNDPKRPELALEVKVDVRAYLVARPGYARYIYVQKAREGTIVQTIAAADGAPFRVLNVESPLPHVRVAWHEATPAERRPEVSGAQWIVESTISGDSPVGALTGNILVRTDHPKQAVLRVPVSGFVRPIIAVTPPVASLSVIDPATTPEVRLHVKNFAEEPIKVTGASTTVPGISAAVTTVEPGRIYYVVLTFGQELAAGPFKGTVQIRTASPKIPVIDVPLDGTGHVGP
jgi:hypothetical protein